MIYAATRQEGRGAPQEPSSANGGLSTVPLPTAWRKPATGSSPSPRLPPSQWRSARTTNAIERLHRRSSSEGSRRRPCCHRPTPPQCCSGRCSLPGRSTCARSMAGRRFATKLHRSANRPRRVIGIDDENGGTDTAAFPEKTHQRASPIGSLSRPKNDLNAK